MKKTTLLILLFLTVIFSAAVNAVNVNIASTPSGAKVYIDSKYYGTTPLTARKLTAGEKMFLFQKSGYPNIYERKDIVAETHAITQVLPIGNKVVKVLVLIYNPYLEAYGKDAITYFRWNNPDTLAQSYINEINAASGGYLTYSVADKKSFDGYITTKTNGYTFSDQDYINCVNTGGKSSTNCNGPQMGL